MCLGFLSLSEQTNSESMVTDAWRIAQILMGDGIKKDTVAVGILMIKIRHAKGLSAQDKSGSSDRESHSTLTCF